MVLQGLSRFKRRPSRFKRNLHRMVGSRSLKVRSWFASSDLNVVSLGVSRLEFACISLQAKLHLDSILGRSLKRKTSRFKRSFIWAVQKFTNFLTLFIQKPNFDPPITQNDFLQCLQVLYAT